MAMLVTLQQAIDHLRLNGTFTVGASPIDPAERDLQFKLDICERVILNYLKTPETAEDEPAIVAAAILIQLGELWRFRGDDPEGQGAEYTDGQLSPCVTNLLRRFRDPALA